jgi:integrase
MPRPPLPIGTMGQIRVYPLGNNRYRATAKFRDYDGVTRRVERVGTTATKARNRLTEACRDRGRTDAAAEITASTKISALAEEWYSEIAIAVEAGDLSPGTGRAYRDRLDNQIIPGIGGLAVREATVPRLDRLLKTVRDRHGVAVAKTSRTVLSGMLGLAVRHGALSTNPVRDAAKLRGKPSSKSKSRRALDLVEVWDLRAKIAADQKAVDWDLPDFVDMMMATGLRIGETAAITWDSLDLDEGTVEVRGTVIRETGVGLYIKLKPKSRSGWRKIELPAWTVAMLKRRRSTAVENEWGAVFTSPAGYLRDPSNTQADLREVFDRAGYDDITSHTFRRTVATLMDNAGLTARAAADQLGHAKVSMTTDVYFGRHVAKTGAAGVLEAVHVEPTTDAERCG